MRVLLSCDTRIFFSSNRSPMLLASAINKFKFRKLIKYNVTT